jgi:predicted DNA-binding transcriptional regulator AlpA
VGSCRRLHVDELLDSRAAAERAGVTWQSWRAYVATGRAPAPICRVGEAPAWTREQVDAWVDRRRSLG